MDGGGLVQLKQHRAEQHGRESSAPMTMAICGFRGVAPTRNPVFKSCDVVPPLDEAMHTIAPTDSAVT